MVEWFWLAALVGCGGAEQAPPPEPEPVEARVVTIGPAITEIALKLVPDQVVGIDSASAQLNGDLPSVGFSRQISAEGVLSLNPTLVLVDATAGPEDVLGQIESVVPVKKLPHERTVDGVSALIGHVAEATGVEGKPVAADFATSCGALPKGDARGKALFVYARGAGTMNVSGTDTAAAAMLALAGLENAVTGYEGYKPLTPEAAIAAEPDYVVFTTHGLEGVGGIEGLREVPGLAQLDAVQQGRVAAVDDFDLLAFGLGTCKGANALAKATGG